MDCTRSPDLESIPGKVSGQWLAKGTRLPIEAILAKSDQYTADEIATDIFQGITPETAWRIVTFARQYAHHPA